MTTAEELRLVRRFDKLLADAKARNLNEPIDCFEGWTDDQKVTFMKSLEVQLPEGTRAPDLLVTNGRKRVVVPDSVMCDVTVDATARDNYRSSVGHYLSWHYVESDQRLEFGSARWRSFVTRPFGTFVFYFRHLVYVVGLVIDGQTGYVHGCITRVYSGGVVDREHVLQFKKEAHEKDYIKSRRIHRLKFNGNYLQGEDVHNVDLSLPILRKTIVDIASFRPGIDGAEPSPVLFQTLIIYAAEAPRIRAVFRTTSHSLSIPADGLNIEVPVVIRIPMSQEPFVLNYRQLSSCALEFLRMKPEKFKHVTGTSPRNLYQILSSILLLRRNDAYKTQFIMPDAPREGPDEPLQGPRGQQFTGKKRLELLNKRGTKYSAVLHGGERPYESENWIINLWEEAEKLCHHPLDVPQGMEIKMGRELDGEGRSNSELVDAGLADAEGPPPNNGNLDPFHGPSVPREVKFVAQTAGQFIAQMPHPNQQVQHHPPPDQASNADSMVQADSSYTCSAPQFFTQGSISYMEMGQQTGPNDDMQMVSADKILLQVQPAEQNASNQQQPSIPLAELLMRNLQLLLNSFHFSVEATTDSNHSNEVQLMLTVAGTNPICFSLPVTKNQRGQYTITEMENKEEAPIEQQKQAPVLTINRQLIKKMYFRKKINIRKREMNKDSCPSSNITTFHEDCPAQMLTPAKKIVSRKRRATPISAKDVRRSKRSLMATDGHKPQTSASTDGPMPRSKDRSKKTFTSSLSEGGHREIWVVSFGGDHRAAPCC